MTKFYVCSILAILSLPLVWSQSSGSNETQKAVIVVAEGRKGQVNYKINSQPTTDLLLSLSKLEEERGSKCPVIALIDARLPIEEIWGIEGVAGKAQFTSVRVYIFFRDTGKMSEIRQLPAVPLSMNPPVE